MLTPLEIENKRFKKEVFGYNQVEVEDFLSVVSAEYEKIYKDNNAALARINMLTDAIKQYKSMEETLQNAMTIAQKSGEEIRAEAKVAADRIVVTAEEQAQNIIADARRKAAEISYKAEEIKMTSELFKKQTIELLMEQLDVLKKRNSIASPEFESLESFAAPTEESETSKPSAASSDAMDLSKILADVGKISKSIDGFEPSTMSAADGESEFEEIPGLELGQEIEPDLDGEPKGFKEFFGDED